MNKTYLAMGGIFAAGAAVGFTGAYLFLKKKFEDKFKQEVESAELYYKRKEAADSLQKGLEAGITSKPAYDDALTDLGYNTAQTKPTKFDSDVIQPVVTVEDNIMGPEVCSYDDFESIMEYETVSLMYYADGYLVEEETDEIITDEYALIGENAMNALENGEDTVYVVDDTKDRYYVITKVNANYADI